MPFCDWFSGFINYDRADLHDGHIITTTANGEIELDKFRPLAVKGSYDDKIIIKSCLIPAPPEWSLVSSDSIYRVYISGNPTKFFQGHNVYGHSDMLGVIRDFIKIVLQKIEVDELSIKRILNDKIRITRIDVTNSYVMDSANDVKSWLRAASQYMTGKNQKVDNEKTLYVGKNSRRVAIKVYDKATEMMMHRKTFNLDDVTFCKLHNIASNLLRFEVTLRGMKLDDLGLNDLLKVSNEMFEKEFGNQLEKMNLPENIELVENVINDLPLKYAGIYQKWQNGLIIKDTMSLSSFKRYRKYFLDNFNLDISMPPRDISHTNIIPLWRVIQPGAAYVPSFDDENLYAPIMKSFN